MIAATPTIGPTERVTPSGLVVPAHAVGAPIRGETRIWTRTPDPAWVATLRTLSPPSEAHTWLHLAWEPGDPWEPIERWMLYQVVPKARVRPEVLLELTGVDPRSTGHYCGPSSLCGCKHRPDLWVGGKGRLINRTEWRLYRELETMGFAGWARAWWVIQGNDGGHPRHYTPAESALAELADLPNEPPVPGELCYADPNARTWEAVQRYDRVARGSRLLERTVEHLAAEEREDAIAVRRATLEMLSRTTQQALGDYGAAMRRELSDVRLGGWAYDDDATDYDAEFEDFVQDVD